MVKIILRLEGLAILLFSLYFYNLINLGWLTFLLLLFVPDLSMVGYLRDKKTGSVTYNLVHNYVSGIILISSGILTEADLVISLGLILTAHVGMDRFLGFGLKYKTAFNHTHLQKI